MIWLLGIAALLLAAHALDVARAAKREALQAQRENAATQVLLTEALMVVNQTFAIEAHNWRELREMFNTIRADALEAEQRARDRGDSCGI